MSTHTTRDTDTAHHRQYTLVLKAHGEPGQAIVHAEASDDETLEQLTAATLVEMEAIVQSRPDTAHLAGGTWRVMAIFDGWHTDIKGDLPDTLALCDY